MDTDIKPDWIVATLGLQGVATEAARARTHAGAISIMQKGAAPAFARIELEEEPAGFIVQQRRGAP